MISLSKQLAKYFAKDVRSRGSSYYYNGRVHIKDIVNNPPHNTTVYAMVSGNKKYNVVLNLDKQTLRPQCSCPYFMDWHEPCKHIWATILSIKFKADEIDDTTLTRPFQKKTSPRQPSWEDHLTKLSTSMKSAISTKDVHWPEGREILYIIDIPTTSSSGILTLEIASCQRKQTGGWGKPKVMYLYPEQITALPTQSDREIIALLRGAEEAFQHNGTYSDSQKYLSPWFHIPPPLHNILIPQICKTGRCLVRLSIKKENLQSISWDNGDPWEFCLDITKDQSNNHYNIKGLLRRQEDQMQLTEPTLLLAGGLVIARGYAARLNDFNAFGWVSLLRKQETITVPVSHREKLLKKLFQLPHQPRVDLPEEIRYEEIKVPPQPRVIVKKAKLAYYGGREKLQGELSFIYQGNIIAGNDTRQNVFDSQKRQLIIRDRVAECNAIELLKRSSFRYVYSYISEKYTYEIFPKKFPRAIRLLLKNGWLVEAEGKLYRRPGSININVTTGIDWFEVHSTVEFGDQKVSLPELLTALKRGENMIALGDGSFGMLPEEWLKKYGLLAGLGTIHDNHLRFSKTQVGLLDVLISAQPEAQYDEAFNQARNRLREFQGIKPADAPSDFIGNLRNYQKDGLGWLVFLRQFEFGGCLADDMGLGKTIQVLVLLETKRSKHKGNGNSYRPSLIVVPKSLVFNWKKESQRFTPKLKVLEYTDNKRLKEGNHFYDYDIILTTYGILRRDALYLKDIHFDYCILDESQAIKNMNTASAKAARLMHSDHRLALSGTPIENHLGELWSLFEFLNPGMLGSASIFKLKNSELRSPDEDTRSLLSQGLRPFILRRTKSQVAKELPPKTEQTIYCDLEPRQKKLYNELLFFYRSSLLDKVEQQGINKLKMNVLEALLRLRQAACHPGLIDKSRIGESSAKLDVLLPQLLEVMEEGHKALVFSQFTSFLSIARARLDKNKIFYEYLDGKTRDRQGSIEHFQNDPNCKLFLISLKAGGLGLNLTAAEYVFLLDPWWNPAVEAQAIDRTHRIGQTQNVFAYRLITRHTVEEKVLHLQRTKRDLADAIINADNSLIRNLTREDLEMLLS